MKKLKERASDLAKVAGKKQKHTFFLANIFVGLTSDIFYKGPEHHHEKETKAPEEKTKSLATPVFTTKENSTLEQHIEVLDWHHKNSQNQTKIACHFGPTYPNLQIKQPLISKWVKQETKICEQCREYHGFGYPPRVTGMVETGISMGTGSHSHTRHLQNEP